MQSRWPPYSISLSKALSFWIIISCSITFSDVVQTDNLDMNYLWSTPASLTCSRCSVFLNKKNYNCPTCGHICIFPSAFPFTLPFIIAYIPFLILVVRSNIWTYSVMVGNCPLKSTLFSFLVLSLYFKGLIWVHKPHNAYGPHLHFKRGICVSSSIFTQNHT